MFTATQFPRGQTLCTWNSALAASKLSPDNAQHSVQYHVTMSMACTALGMFVYTILPCSNLR